MGPVQLPENLIIILLYTAQNLCYSSVFLKPNLQVNDSKSTIMEKQKEIIVYDVWMILEKMLFGKIKSKCLV